jgi:pimeloyl-ACP methyl ester carboxylesterase
MQARLRHRLERYVGLGFEELDGRHIAPHMRVPLLVVHDESDREVPFEAGATLASAWPGARLIKTQGLGHQRILRDPNVVDAVVRFVSAPSPSTREQTEE